SRAEALREFHGGTAAVIAGVRAFAVEHGGELVLADLEVRHVQAVHAAAMQGVDLALRVQVVRDFLAVDLQAHGIEGEELTDVHREKECHLRVRRKQELLLEQEEIAVQVQHLVLQRLDFPIQSLELLDCRLVLCVHGGDGEREEQREPCDALLHFPLPHACVTDHSRNSARISVRYFSSYPGLYPWCTCRTVPLLSTRIVTGIASTWY